MNAYWVPCSGTTLVSISLFIMNFIEETHAIKVQRNEGAKDFFENFANFPFYCTRSFLIFLDIFLITSNFNELIFRNMLLSLSIMIPETQIPLCKLAILQVVY